MAKSIVSVYCSIRFLLGLSLSFFFATYSLFLLGAGLDLFEINLVNACYMIACFCLEVPTGAIADVFGRKISFLLSCLVLSASFLVYYFSDSFGMFILAEVVGALGSTLYSGAFKSWMIDEIHETGEYFDLTHAYRRGEIFDGAGVVIGVVIGSYLGAVNIAWPWLCSAALVFLTGIVGMIIIKEKSHKKTENKHRSYQLIIDTAKSGFSICLSSGRIRYAICLGFVWSFVLMALNMYWQPRFLGLGIETSHLGWLHSGTEIVLIAGVLCSRTIFGFFQSNGRSLGALSLLLALAIFFAAISDSLLICLPMFYLHQIARGAYRPLLDDYLNKEIDGKIRATIQSYYAMIATLGAGLGLVASGLIAKHHSIEASWIFSALVVFAFFVFSAITRRS